MKRHKILKNECNTQIYFSSYRILSLSNKTNVGYFKIGLEITRLRNIRRKLVIFVPSRYFSSLFDGKYPIVYAFFWEKCFGVESEINSLNREKNEKFKYGALFLARTGRHYRCSRSKLVPANSPVKVCTAL